MSKVIKSGDAHPYAEFERAFFGVSTSEMAEPVGLEEKPLPSSPDPRQVLAAAHAEAERFAKEAYEEGLRRGEAAGRLHFDESIGHAAEALISAAAAIRLAHEHFLASLEPQVVGLVRSIAERILRRELAQDNDLIVRTVHGVLDHLAECPRLTVHVHPSDVMALKQLDISLLEQFNAVKELVVEADESIEPGGCIAETPMTQVDARIDTQLRHILDEMMG